MNKLAQERGLLNKLREKSNITGKILESLNPEFQEMMEKLRTTDAAIREDSADIKANVRAAKSHLNRRDYLSAATNISAFHEKCRFISAKLKKFIDGVDLKHYKFLLDQFDDEQKEQLFGYDPNRELSSDEDTGSVSDQVITAALKKRAGLSDWWFKMTDPLADVAHNLTTERGVAMRALEKRFSISFLKELKVNTNVMVTKTQRFLQEMLTIFKRLATALAKRNVDQYVEAAKRFISRFAGYHAQFVKYYEKSIIPLKQQHQKIQDEVAKDVKPFPAPMDENYKAPPASPPAPGEHPFVKQQPVVTDRRRPGQPVPIGQPEVPNSDFAGNLKDMLNKEPEEAPFPLTKRKAEFISSLEKHASISDSKSMMLEILAFSEKLDDVDPEASLKLLAIAEGIMEDINNADMFEKDPFAGEEEEDPLA